MPAPTAKAIHEALEQAIFDAALSGAAVRMKLANREIEVDIEKARKVSAEYRRLAIQRGELEAGPAETPVTVSFATIKDYAA